MKSQLISSMVSFTLGTGASLIGLWAWTGTTDLQDIKDAIQLYVEESEQHSSALLEEYNVTVDNANAEIGDYKLALEQANSNISQLITAYEKAEQEHQTELEQAQASAEQDLADLQAELDDLYARMDSQYETDMNEIVEKANAEIEKANMEVAETSIEVQGIINDSLMSDIVQNGERHELDTTGSKEVVGIEGIIGEVDGE